MTYIHIFFFNSMKILFLEFLNIIFSKVNNSLRYVNYIHIIFCLVFYLYNVFIYKYII